MMGAHPQREGGYINRLSYTPVYYTALRLGGAVVVRHLVRVEERKSHADQLTEVSLLKDGGESGENLQKRVTVRICVHVYMCVVHVQYI